MVAQSIASRSRRPHAEPEDEFMGRALEVADWMKKNVVVISSVFGVLVLLLAGFFWYKSDQARREEDAAIAFLPVEQAVLAGDPAVAARELDLYIQRHDGTVHADEARLLLATVHLQQGQAAEAMAALGDLPNDLRSPLGPQAAMLYGAAQEANGQAADAITTYLRVGQGAENSFHREEGLAAAARVREQTGDRAGAAELYARLVEEAENPTISAMYEMRRAEVEAMIASGQAFVESAPAPPAGAVDSAAVTDAADTTE